MLVSLIIFIFHKKNISSELLSLAKLNLPENFAKSDFDTNKILQEIFSYNINNSNINSINDIESPDIKKIADQKDINTFLQVNEQLLEAEDYFSTSKNEEDIKDSNIETIKDKDDKEDLYYRNENFVKDKTSESISNDQIETNENNDINSNSKIVDQLNTQNRASIIYEQSQNANSSFKIENQDIKIFNNLYFKTHFLNIEKQKMYDHETVEYLLNVNCYI